MYSRKIPKRGQIVCLNKLFALYKLHQPTIAKASEIRNVLKQDLNVVMVGSARKDAGIQAAGADELKARSAKQLCVRRTCNDV